MSNDQLALSKSQLGESIGDLRAIIQEYFHSSTFSDLTIVTKDRELKVHKIIICGQSGYFSRLFKRDWNETQEATIRLVEDDPIAIEAMIHFMYEFDYDSSGSDRSRVSPMLFNVKVYQVGDKYDVPKLKAQARQKFINAIEKCWEMDDFPIAIADTYTTTISTDRGLRDPLVGTVLNHIDVLLTNEDFVQVLRETIGFAADLVQSQKNMVELKRYRCPDCSEKWAVAGSVNVRYCPLCSYNTKKWAGHIVND